MCAFMSLIRKVYFVKFCVYWQWFLEVSLGPFSNVNDKIMPMSDAVSSKGLKTTVALKPASLTAGSVASAENGRGSGRLPAGAGSLPLLQSVSMVYVLLLRCFFSVLTLYSPRSIVWGLFFFLLTFLVLCCNFLQFPVFLSCPPPCHICMLCMGRLMAYFTGTCD